MYRSPTCDEEREARRLARLTGLRDVAVRIDLSLLLNLASPLEARKSIQAVLPRPARFARYISGHDRGGQYCDPVCDLRSEEPLQGRARATMGATGDRSIHEMLRSRSPDFRVFRRAATSASAASGIASVVREAAGAAEARLLYAADGPARLRAGFHRSVKEASLLPSVNPSRSPSALGRWLLA